MSATATGPRPRSARLSTVAELAADYDARLILTVESAASAAGDDDAMRAWLASIGDPRAERYTGPEADEVTALRAAFTARALDTAAELALALRHATGHPGGEAA